MPMHSLDNATSSAGGFTSIEVPILSDVIRQLDVPLSLVNVANGFIYVSGIPPLSCTTGEIVTGDIEAQTHASLNAVKACLKAAGVTFEDVVSVKIYAANAGHYDAINRVYKTFFSAPYPTRTFIPVGSWWTGFDLEIECVALQPKGDKQ